MGKEIDSSTNGSHLYQETKERVSIQWRRMNANLTSKGQKYQGERGLFKVLWSLIMQCHLQAINIGYKISGGLMTLSIHS